ncbi:hypothetical protein Aph01nite_61450 [Acrocarpospora phusangensis]|uniref:Carrier domain-containing protein n=1 Tax=Acrocarpospora phusangensis TaxID=1070424 RepID=A0A919QK73_9ACTN|nr:amino acid adenylation domain-containing protein [Acrocarpospora phusangensis]GIH27835.1 hypothetical protein Aph01nite_61450 [Acrocarpospora phusangensis]
MSLLGLRLDRLPQEQRGRFFDLLRTDWRDRPIHLGGTGRARVTPLQAALLREPPATTGFAVRLTGPLDTAALAAAWRGLIARQQALRMSVRGGPVLWVSPPPTATLPVEEVPGDELPALLAGLAGTRFDPADAQPWSCRLLRVAPDQHVLAFAASSVVIDRGSLELLLGELFDLYRAADLPEPSLTFGDVANWSAARFDRDRDGLRSRWRERLSGLTPTAPQATQQTGDPAHASQYAELSPETVDAVERAAEEWGTRPSSVYLAACYELLRRYCGQSELVIGVPSTGRRTPDLRAIAGCFDDVHPVPLRGGGGLTFRQLVGHVDTAVRDALDDAALPSPELAAMLGEPIRVVCDTSPAPRLGELPGLTAEWLPGGDSPPAHDLVLRIPGDGELSAGYRAASFDPGSMDDLLRHYAHLLAGLLASDGPAERVALLPGEEAADLAARWQGRYRPVPPTTLHGWFAAQAARTPDAVAVTAGDGRLTYAELDARANRFAHVLRDHGVTGGDLVAVCVARGLDQVTAVLAALKAGAAFLPMDPSHPPHRLSHLVEDARPTLLVAGREALDDLAAAPGRLALEDLIRQADEMPAHAPAVTGGDLAYVMYTSGSTGTPKGVLVSHTAVVNFTLAVAELFDLSPADRILGYASVTFDVSIFETFGALLTGGRLCVVLDNERLDIDRLQALLERSGITVTDLPPPVMALLEPERLPGLRIAFVGGEAFTGELVNRWRTGRRFFNGYGPTECTVTMVVHECDLAAEASPPIGLPIANHVAHVLDERLRPVPYEVPGELVIGGLGLADGYLNRPGLTAERFVPDPFGSAPTGRLYRTGDLVRRRRDGTLVFMGRIDRQLKIRGVRIEPAEIEVALEGHPAVAQAVVDVWTDPVGQRHLVAYVGRRAAHDATDGDLREFLAARLPAALVPDFVVLLDELPLTSAGKVDRAALPYPEIRSTGTRTRALSKTEHVLAEELLKPVLGIADIGVDANFFAIGGSSLQAAQLISAIRRRFGVEAGVADFFRDPTVAGLAALVDTQLAARLDDEDLLDLLEGMSEEEAERILSRGLQEGTT